MSDDRQRIEVLFTDIGRTVAINLGGEAPEDGLIDALARALETDDPRDAARDLAEGLDARTVIQQRA